MKDYQIVYSKDEDEKIKTLLEQDEDNCIIDITEDWQVKHFSEEKLLNKFVDFLKMNRYAYEIDVFES